MTKQYTYTNGICTNIIETTESSPGPRKFTYINGLLTNVSAVDPALPKSSGSIVFINGIMTGTNATSGSITPPISGSVLYMSGSYIKPYVDLTNEPEFIDVDFGDFTWEGYYWPEESTLNEPTANVYYHGGILIAKSWPGTPTDFGWNLGWGIYSGPPYDGKIVFTGLASTPVLHEGLVYLQVAHATNNVGPPWSPIDASLFLNNWHHVAFTDHHTFSGGYTIATLRTIWLDGVKVAENYFDSYTNNYEGETDAYQKTTLVPIYLTAGFEYNVNPDLVYSKMKQGWMRLSNTTRYTTSFAPPDRLSPPASDGNTLGLWYANEGSGSTIINYQGDTNRNGTAYNTTWITS
jgi:hypothetical protein